MPDAEMPRATIASPGLGKDGALVADLLKLLLKIRAKESDVAPRLICALGRAGCVAAGQRDGLSMLEGWRYDVFGKDAIALCEGRLAFSVKSGRMVMSEIGEE
jgi:ribonuclease D